MATMTAPGVEGQHAKGPSATGLPVSTLREAIPYLRRPFTPEAVRFKVQSVFRGATGCLIVAYIDARLVIERLNLVIPEWSEDYAPVPGQANLQWCYLTVDGVTHRDVGETPKGMSKDLVSDALKRAAVKFGVGVSIYALPEIKVMMSDSRGRIEKRTTGSKETIVLTPYGHQSLRSGYERWLIDYGIDKFGEPFDHGDVEGQTIDPEVEASLNQNEPLAAVERVPGNGTPLPSVLQDVLERALALDPPHSAYSSLATLEMVSGSSEDNQFEWARRAQQEMDALVAERNKTSGDATGSEGATSRDQAAPAPSAQSGASHSRDEEPASAVASPVDTSDGVEGGEKEASILEQAAPASIDSEPPGEQSESTSAATPSEELSVAQVEQGLLEAFREAQASGDEDKADEAYRQLEAFYETHPGDES